MNEMKIFFFVIEKNEMKVETTIQCKYFYAMWCLDKAAMAFASLLLYSFSDGSSGCY